ncbi:MAG: hypothetical protein IJF33_07680 [Clostridia bacterium]|nr:hypothetical protein [Clostridia bacterium]
MKKIVIIGDSISAWYKKLVKIAFEGQAEVYFPKENCRFASYVLRTLPDWKTEMKCGDDVDVVHWNAGLWDDLIIADGEHHVPLERYREDVERICKTIKILFPKAKIIFATSTPVLEDGYEARFRYYRRYNKDTEVYNAAAVEIVKRYGGEIDDLYALMKDVPESYHSDVTHFYTKQATKRMTDQVIKCLEACCDIKATPLDYDLLFKGETEIVGI